MFRRGNLGSRNFPEIQTSSYFWAFINYGSKSQVELHDEAGLAVQLFLTK